VQQQAAKSRRYAVFNIYVRIILLPLEKWRKKKFDTWCVCTCISYFVAISTNFLKLCVTQVDNSWYDGVFARHREILISNNVRLTKCILTLLKAYLCFLVLPALRNALIMSFKCRLSPFFFLKSIALGLFTSIDCIRKIWNTRIYGDFMLGNFIRYRER